MAKEASVLLTVLELVQISIGFFVFGQMENVFGTF